MFKKTYCMSHELDKNLMYIKMAIKNCKFLTLLVYNNAAKYCLILMKYNIACISNVINCSLSFT